VAVLYAAAIGDEKRDTVEYTSDAFMGAEHTMLTYTRCMDSALCVPLMIDAVVLCNYFSQRGVAPAEAAEALAYLFKVNEGAAAGIDPGFFAQSAKLSALLDSLPAGPGTTGQPNPEQNQAPPTKEENQTPPRGDMGGGEEEAAPPSAVYVGGVLCVGLACLDLQLLGAAEPTSREAIATFSGCDARAGGSPSNTGAALATLGVAPVWVVASVGDDLHGAELQRQWAAAGMDTSLVLRAAGVSTSVAVLPVYSDGGRGCWVDLSANDRLDADAVLGLLSSSTLGRGGGEDAPTSTLAPGLLSPSTSGPSTLGGGAASSSYTLGSGALASPLRRGGGPVAAVHVGYPHLLRGLQGEGLARLLRGVGELPGEPIVSVDLNGVSAATHSAAVLGPSLPNIDLLHANLDEARILTGTAAPPGAAVSATGAVGEEERGELRAMAARLHAGGVAVVALTLGSRGAFASVTADAGRLRRVGQLERAAGGWCGKEALLPALPPRGRVNANGAGDAFSAGMLASMVRAEAVSLEAALGAAQQSALERISGAWESRE